MTTAKKSTIIYVDGSHVRLNTSLEGVLGWGLIALHDDTLHEESGSLVIHRKQNLRGEHETLAMLHALRYIIENKIPANEVSIYCDDAILGHAPTFLYPGNYMGHKADLVINRLALIAKHTGYEESLPEMMALLSEVRVIKLKGHQQHVYQERVDYLANTRANIAAGDDQVELNFDDWLKKGILIYSSPDKARRWVAPFVNHFETELKACSPSLS